MEQYIPKSAVVAEIRRWLGETDKGFPNEHNLGRFDAYERTLSFIENLEVKEVDLNRKIRRYRIRNPIIQHREESLYDYMANVAKHFFELGMRFSAIGSDYIEGVRGYYETTTK